MIRNRWKNDDDVGDNDNNNNNNEDTNVNDNPVILNLPPTLRPVHHFPSSASQTLAQLLLTRVNETSSALLSQASAAAAAAISAATIRFNGRHEAELKAMCVT